MVIVEHNKALRRLIECNIGNFEPNTQVFVTDDNDAALAYLQKQPIDMLLVDTESRSDADFELVKLAHHTSPNTRIILMSIQDEDRVRAKLRRLKLPVLDFIDKSTFLTELLEFDGR